MDQILPLSLSSRMIQPVGKEADPRCHEESTAAPAARTAACSSEPVAPYQALPVSGDLITHNITPALPVIEGNELSQEVGGGWPRPSPTQPPWPR